jgi:hypothetical protein
MHRFPGHLEAIPSNTVILTVDKLALLHEFRIVPQRKSNDESGNVFDTILPFSLFKTLVPARDITITYDTQRQYMTNTFPCTQIDRFGCRYQSVNTTPFT